MVSSHVQGILILILSLDVATTPSLANEVDAGVEFMDESNATFLRSGTRSIGEVAPLDSNVLNEIEESTFTELSSFDICDFIGCDNGGGGNPSAYEDPVIGVEAPARAIQISNDGKEWKDVVLTADGTSLDCNLYSRIRVITEGETHPVESELSCLNEYSVFLNSAYERWDLNVAPIRTEE